MGLTAAEGRDGLGPEVPRASVLGSVLDRALPGPLPLNAEARAGPGTEAAPVTTMAVDPAAGLFISEDGNGAGFGAVGESEGRLLPAASNGTAAPVGPFEMD